MKKVLDEFVAYCKNGMYIKGFSLKFEDFMKI